MYIATSIFPLECISELGVGRAVALLYITQPSNSRNPLQKNQDAYEYQRSYIDATHYVILRKN